MEVGLFTFAAFCMGAMGSTQMAAHQIALQTVSMAFMVPVGMSYAVTMRIGQHYGAGNLLMVRMAGRLGIGFGGCVMLMFGLLFWLAPHLVIGLFLDINDPAFAEIVVLATKLLAIAALFEFFDGTQTIAMGAIRGLKDARTTFLIGFGLLLADRCACRVVARLLYRCWRFQACGGAGAGPVLLGRGADLRI